MSFEPYQFARTLHEEYSSDGDETECHSEVDKKEMELKEPDIENLNVGQAKRLSVSAEAYGEWNKKNDNFVAKVYKKDEEEKSKIREALNESFLFNHLNKVEMETIVNAFFDKNVEKGVNIINEGDEGDLLYVIDEGEVEIFKTKENEKEILTILKSKDVFGELALLYNSKRAATAKALTNCHLWTLDRESFTYIIKDNVAKKRQLYEDVLKQVTILKDMDPYERSKVADCLKTKTYANGDIIINEGEQGNTFYILIDGNAIALKDNKVIKTYNKGDYFGELALLKNQPRAATVKAQNNCQVVYLDRKSFKRLLGPIENILYRNVENYKKVLNQLGLDSACIGDN
ncbi:CAMP-dependent protein kinase regulatory subunit, putative [Plasmodium ovale wallikeri]|uniref:cAMP-dependent protein kinase regulatory subunit, putative n=1 Tax=Plasmodium ovale wallikeri TaxID=864142 RepID=A0A1A8ZYK6_PLAOA|nr:CAMP-dependent protein kinase regulatory subunit, putative [Plasmodium ovale wallikeri]SBT49356.1 CAMP-dependent protein kinase regulatory subunit, putative [Plasmodium ovale wallikeri]